MDAISEQRDYYRRTAEAYDSMHVDDTDEHSVALAAFVGLCALDAPTRILDVGAGTGRAMTILAASLPGVEIFGIEPVEALRQIGHRKNVREDRLIEGDVLAIDFADNTFDYVIETGVLHHVPDPARAVSEMVRVARKGVMLSDANKFGQGSPMVRNFKGIVRRLGLWEALVRVQTKGKISKYSEGDGVYYSYSVFDNLDAVAPKFPHMKIMNTVPTDRYDLRSGAAQAMVFATR